jgi:nucleotide-binding universal stress UspA family protein
MAFSKILVACDFSDPAARALGIALDFSQRLGAKLEVAHVHPELYDGRADVAAGIPWPAPGQTERYLRFVEDELRATVRAKDNAAAETSGYHVLRGDPAKQLIALARELNADLICLGSTGKGAVERVFLGSVSQRVLRESTVPVLVVH